MVGEGFHAVGVEALLADPREGALLRLLVRRDAGGDLLLPALAGIAAVGEQENELALLVFHLHGEKAVGVAGDVDELDGAVAQQVIGEIAKS